MHITGNSENGTFTVQYGKQTVLLNNLTIEEIEALIDSGIYVTWDRVLNVEHACMDGMLRDIHEYNSVKNKLYWIVTDVLFHICMKFDLFDIVNQLLKRKEV